MSTMLSKLLLALHVRCTPKHFLTVLAIVAAVLQHTSCAESDRAYLDEAEKYQAKADELSLSVKERRHFRDLAIESYSRAIGKSEGTTRNEALIQRGKLYFRNQDYKNAILDFTAAIDGGISEPKIFMMRGQCYDALSELELALNDYTKAKSLGSQEVVFEYRGQVLLKLGRYKEAVRDFTEFLKKHENSWSVYESRGDVFAATGEKDKAIQDYDAAQKILRTATLEVLGRELSSNEQSPNEERLRSKIKQLQIRNGK